jgi:glycosyltransferase involved in cell wall biosynthesis
MTSKIRILHIFSTFNTGGMEAHLLNFLRKADFDKYEHLIFVNRDEGELREDFHRLPVRIIKMSCGPKRYFYSLPYGIHFSKKNRIDIIHGHSFWCYLYAFFLSLMTGIPFIATDYGLGTWKRKIHHSWESAIFKRAGLVIGASRAIVEKELSLVEGAGNVDHKFKLVYPVIRDIQRPDPSEHEKKAIRKKLAIHNDRLILTIIGRIIRLKGHRFAIEAVDRINREGTKVNLLIVGRKDEPGILKRDDIRKDYITYTDYYEPIEDIWSVTDVFLIPSISEGTPLVLLEYFAVGQIVIASNISGNSELIRDGWNGFLFESEDVDALTAKIEHVIGLDETETIRNNAKRNFLENLSPTVQTRRMEKYYSELAR